MVSPYEQGSVRVNTGICFRSVIGYIIKRQHHYQITAQGATPLSRCCLIVGLLFDSTPPLLTGSKTSPCGVKDGLKILVPRSLITLFYHQILRIKSREIIFVEMSYNFKTVQCKKVTRRGPGTSCLHYSACPYCLLQSNSNYYVLH